MKKIIILLFMLICFFLLFISNYDFISLMCKKNFSYFSKFDGEEFHLTYHLDDFSYLINHNLTVGNEKQLKVQDKKLILIRKKKVVKENNKDVKVIVKKVENKDQDITQKLKKIFNTWKTVNGEKYYYGSDGSVVKGLQVIDDKTYYFDNDGKMYKGWLLTNNTYRYFDENGIMITGLSTIEGKTYYFDKHGNRYIGLLKEKEGTKYFDKQGVMLTGLQTIDGNTYYFDATGNAFVGNKVLDGIQYSFDSNGVLQKKVLVSEKKSSCISNKKLIGWQKINGEKCFFNQYGKLIKANAKKIIDISYWQGNIDWKRVKEKSDIDGVIIRIGYTATGNKLKNIDSYFVKNLKGVTNYKIPYGFYYYGYATTKKEAQEEATLVINVLKKYKAKPIYPIYYDAEEASISKVQYEKVIVTFNEMLKKAGYKVGVYGNYSAFTYSYLNSKKIKQYPIWIAQWNSICTYSGKYSMWQYTNNGRIPGIQGRVDISIL